MEDILQETKQPLTPNGNNDVQMRLVVLFGLLIITIVVAVFVFNTSRYPKDTSAPAVETPLIPITSTDPTDVAFCEGKEGDDLDACFDAVRDAKLYEQAIAQFNVVICDEIRDTSLRPVCVETVETGKSYVQENDPTYYVNVVARSTDFTQAVREYEALIEAQGIENVPTETLIDLAMAYGNMAVLTHTQDTLLPKAKNILAVVDGREKDNPDALIAYGHLQEVRGDLTGALSYYEHALALDDSHMGALTSRGHVYSMMGMIENAIADFTRAATLDTAGTEVKIYSNLCRIYSDVTETHDEAITQCRRVIAIPGVDPTSLSQAHGVLATIYLAKNDTTEARKSLLVAESLFPRDPNVLTLLARLARAEENFVSAEEYARKALGYDVKKTVAYTQLAYALYRQGNYDSAIEYANKGLSVAMEDISLLDPYKPAEQRELYYVLANTYHAMGNVEEGRRMKEKGDALFTTTTNQ